MRVMLQPHLFVIPTRRFLSLSSSPQTHHLKAYSLSFYCFYFIHTKDSSSPSYSILIREKGEVVALQA
eukprot:gene10313-7210_t